MSVLLNLQRNTTVIELRMLLISGPAHSFPVGRLTSQVLFLGFLGSDCLPSFLQGHILFKHTCRMRTF